jgi:hypothetical protein
LVAWDRLNPKPFRKGSKFINIFGFDSHPQVAHLVCRDLQTFTLKTGRAAEPEFFFLVSTHIRLVGCKPQTLQVLPSHVAHLVSIDRVGERSQPVGDLSVKERVGMN